METGPIPRLEEHKKGFKLSLEHLQIAGGSFLLQ